MKILKKSYHLYILLGMFLISILSGCVGSSNHLIGKCKWAGVRESTYGIANFYSSFPSAAIWATAINHMSRHWSGSTPTAIWLVGVVDSETTGTILQFDAPDGSYDSKIRFKTPTAVNHEACLQYFDANGIKVFLQIEPGFASVTDQINAVLKKFASHNCVAGLAIDVEWYQNYSSNSSTLAFVNDETAQKWEELILSYNPHFRLVLKHWDPKYLPQNYKGQIIFCCDGQGNSSEAQFLSEHKKMADFAYPNPIIYQIGYPSDETNWWKNASYSDAPKQLGNNLITQTPADQPCGIIWVDFNFDHLPH